MHSKMREENTEREDLVAKRTSGVNKTVSVSPPCVSGTSSLFHTLVPVLWVNWEIQQVAGFTSGAAFN